VTIKLKGTQLLLKTKGQHLNMTIIS